MQECTYSFNLVSGAVLFSYWQVNTTFKTHSGNNVTMSSMLHPRVALNITAPPLYFTHPCRKVGRHHPKTAYTHYGLSLPFTFHHHTQKPSLPGHHIFSFTKAKQGDQKEHKDPQEGRRHRKEGYTGWQKTKNSDQTSWPTASQKLRPWIQSCAPTVDSGITTFVWDKCMTIKGHEPCVQQLQAWHCWTGPLLSSESRVVREYSTSGCIHSVYVHMYIGTQLYILVTLVTWICVDYIGNMVTH